MIIGQGLVGTWMSYHLDKAGISYKIINNPTIKSASSVASGVINPVTGRRIVQTWLIETILPYAVEQYKAFEQKMKVGIIKHAPTILIHPSLQMKESFEFRLNNENVYLLNEDEKKWTPYFESLNGMGAIEQCYWIDLNKMTQHWQSYLQENNKLIAEDFKLTDVQLHDNFIIWKELQADKIIFCDGISSMNNPYFNYLPFAPNKGEALIIKAPTLPSQHIYKKNLSIIPWKDDLFWVGSNYEWTYDNDLPSESFKEKMVQGLNQLLKVPYEVVDHIAGIRPTNTQRRPFVGVHPKYHQLAICNGMGTKGCSLAPYFTNQLLAHLEQNAPIHEEANIKRFDKLCKD